jgi:hypothetical protein
MRFYIQTMTCIGLTVETGIKAELPLQLRKVSLTNASTYPNVYGFGKRSQV